MPPNLLAIVFCQAALLALMLALARARHIEMRVSWPLALAIGVGFGMLMDAVFGAYGIFAYLPNGPNTSPVEPRNLQATVLIFNALASYGLASTTIATIADRIIISASTSGRNWAIRIALAPFLGGLCILFSQRASIVAMFAWGAIVVGSGELALYLSDRAGPFLALIALKRWKPAALLWTFSALTGTFYEISNAYFPFWVWLPESNFDPMSIKFLVAAIGYIALLHPLAVFYVILKDS